MKHRIAPLLLPSLLLLPVFLPCHAEDQPGNLEVQFVKGLQNRTYYDLAEKHLKALLARTTEKTNKATYLFALADNSEKTAKAVLSAPGVGTDSRLQLREGHLAKAEKSYRDVLKIAPKHESATKARFAIGALLKQRATTLKRRWEKLESDMGRLAQPLDPKKKYTPEEEARSKEDAPKRAELQKNINAATKDAVKYLKEAISHLTDLIKVRNTELEKARKAAQDAREAKVLQRLDEERRLAEEEWVRARFELYQTQITLGEILTVKNAEGKKNIESAAVGLKDINMGIYHKWVIGKYATMLEGHCYSLLGKYKVALKKFDENFAEKDHPAINDAIQKTYFRKAMCAKDAKDFRMVVYTIEGVNYTVTRKDVKPKDITQKRTIKHIAADFGADPETVRKQNKMTTYEAPVGKNLKIYIGLFSRYEGIEEEEIGVAAKVLAGEGLLEWGLQMRGKEHQKVWRRKVRKGLSYLGEIASGKGPWSRQAQQLLSEWSEKLNKIGIEIVTLTGLYSEGFDTFIKAHKMPASRQKRAALEDSIRKFQRVIIFWQAEGDREESASYKEKVADSWQKIGAAFYFTNRLKEAALAWNACDANFPENPNAEKAGFQSTLVMGQLYRDMESGEAKDAEGYAYADIINDFVSRHPDHPKTGDMLYEAAKVLRARKDYLAAADAYGRVPQISKNYGISLYLIGSCYYRNFTNLYKAKKGDTEEAKNALSLASEAFERYIIWVDEEEAPDQATRKRHLEWQGKAIILRGQIYLFPVLKDPDKCLAISANVIKKYSGVLSKRDQAKLFPQVYDERLKAYVMKEDIEGAREMLKKLLTFPKYGGLANAFRYVAQIYVKKAAELAKEAEELRKNKKEEQAIAKEDEASKYKLKAADLYSQLMTKMPKQDSTIILYTADTYFVRAEAYRKKEGDSEKAVPYYTKAAKWYYHYRKLFGADPKQKQDLLLDRTKRIGECSYRTKDYKNSLFYLLKVQASYPGAVDPNRVALQPLIGHTYKQLAIIEKNPAEKKNLFDKAAKCWAVIKNTTKNGENFWWEAIYEIPHIFFVAGNYADSHKQISTTTYLYPTLGGEDWQPKFKALLLKLKEKLKSDKTKVNRIDEILKKIDEDSSK